MFKLLSFLSLWTVVHWQVNARVLATNSITLTDVPGFQSVKRDSSTERQMYITRNKNGCLVPSEKTPNTKRDDESNFCVGCSNVFVNSDSVAILPSGLLDGWKDALDSKNTIPIAGTAVPDGPDINLKTTSSDNSFLDDTPIVPDGMGGPSSGIFALTSNENLSGNAPFRLDGTFDVAADRPKIPDWCGSPDGLDVYSVHLMEQWNDQMLPIYQHQAIIVSAIDAVYDIRYHIDGNTFGVPMKYHVDYGFSWAKRILTRFELRGWIVSKPPEYMNKEAALKLWETYVTSVPLPVPEPTGCENCQTWAADVLQKVKECPTYVAMPDAFSTTPAFP
ncbi:hypothetical protein MMC07_004624 [Pseudocyphellaria aurata]|nr:hypothetical protein [Pseudocyphellaria aurata]